MTWRVLASGSLIMLAGLATWLTPQAAAAQAVFASAPTVSRLDNGLTVVSVATDAPGIVAYYTLVRVGARDEVEQGHSGYAHLFEHMMFRGTEQIPQEDYEARLQSFGADNNAYTTQDFTLYTVTAPETALAQIVEIEADRFQHLSYDEDAYRTETGAVRGEYDTHASSPFQGMWEALSEMAFSRHTYGHTTLGYLRDIDAMPEEVDYSRAFFRRYYTPDNTTIIAAGDVDHAALVELVTARYGSWEGRRERPRIPTEPAPREGARRHIDWTSPAAPRVLVGWRTPAFQSGRTAVQRARSLRETAALRVVHGLVFSDSSPFYQEQVVEERRLLELGSWAGDLAQDPHLFIAMATLAESDEPATALSETLDSMQGAIDRLGRGEVTPARVEAVKSHVRYAMLGGLSTPSNVANLVAQFVAVGGEVSALDAYLSALADVTVEDVASVARRYLNADRRFAVTLAQTAPETTTPSGTTTQESASEEGS
ncbi:MAG: M16 family metallopeptidase [Sandaracinaceae bacterium]